MIEQNTKITQFVEYKGVFYIIDSEDNQFQIIKTEEFIHQLAKYSDIEHVTDEVSDDIKKFCNNFNEEFINACNYYLGYHCETPYYYLKLVN